jgi:CRP-like cAMP-binding protein/Fe-S-cluster-containing hydrogenase component 2
MSNGFDPRGEDEGLFARDIDGHLVRMEPATAADFDRDVSLSIDGRSITVKKAVPATDAQGILLRDPDGRAIPRATTIYDAAAQLFADSPGGNPIPLLCHRDHMNPVAVCRVCVVEISKVKRGERRTERKLLPACQHRVEDTMEVQTAETPDPKARERIKAAVGMLTELLLADHPTPCAKESRTRDCELEALARRFNIKAPRFSSRPARGRDDSSLVIAVDHDACILCDRCVRGCNDIKNNQVIGRMGKGYAAKIAFDLDAPMGGSSCVACGECMVSCPTGALTFREVIQADPWEESGPPPEPLSIGDLVENPVADIRAAFSSVSRPFLEWNARSIVRRRYRKGDIICREGQFGSTAFFIERGSVEIYIRTPRDHVSDEAGRGLLGLFRGFRSRLKSRSEDPREGDVARRFIPIDAPVGLPYGKPRAQLHAGDIFGEMTCMSHYPRSATVRAAEDCTVLEMLRNVLYIMQRTPKFRAALEEKFRQRATGTLLGSASIFASLPDEFLAELAGRVSLRRCDPGEVIFRQGTRGDDRGAGGFYLVRSGFVKVSQQRPGGEHVLNYVGPGGHIGEIALMSHIDAIRALLPEGAGVRMATCTALDHVDLVRILASDFRAIVDGYPEVRERLVEEAIRRLEQNRRAHHQSLDVSLGDFLGQGLMNATSLLVLDLEKCTRCDECTKACSDTHQGHTRLIREGLRFDKFLVATSCRSCLDPYCMVGCPVGSIRRRDNSNEIIIEDWCIGCGLCEANCPYGNITMHDLDARDVRGETPEGERPIAVVRKATTCDLCQSLGPGHEPSCVYACPHDAAHRMSGEDLIQLVERGAMR